MTESNYYIFTVVFSGLTIVITVISLWFNRRINKRPVYSNQLELVYSPLFKFISPYLYQPQTNEFVNSFLSLANDIINHNYHLCHPDLIDLCNKLNNDINNNQSFNEDFMELTYHIDRYYDKLCRKSYLPVRDMFFRLNKKQFYNNEHKAIYIVKFVLYAIGQILFGAFLVTVAAGLLLALLQATKKGLHL